MLLVLWLPFVSGYSEGDIPRMGLRVPFVYQLRQGSTSTLGILSNGKKDKKFNSTLILPCTVPGSVNVEGGLCDMMIRTKAKAVEASNKEMTATPPMKYNDL